jgi:flavin reductase (DIM6/NTAB) family NADH-FMN oxidoreductase RutF
MARVSVPLRYAYRLINHGPATLVTTRAGDRANVMAAQWVMPIDFDPPKLAIVVDRTTYTRELFDASGELGVCVPVRGQAALTWSVGSTSGRDADKLAAIETFAAEVIGAPLVAGCLGWLECKVVRSPHLDATGAELDLFVVDVVAASADARAWRDDKLVLDDPELATLHHLGSGRFLVMGEEVSGRAPARVPNT